MNCGDYTGTGASAPLYIWQATDWPMWRYDLAALADALAQVHHAQGLLLGRLTDTGLALRDQASLAALTEDVLKTSEIEGEQLNAQSVRSSIARRLGVDIGALAPVDRHVEGVVDMVLDATTHCHAPLTHQRLFGWHAALFPTGYSGLTQISVGAWRTDATGPMQVVSGPLGRQRVHFEAPPAQRLAAETERFLAWANTPSADPPLIRAGLAHLWLVTLHPFDDGNGRIARAVGDLFLAFALNLCRQAVEPLRAAIGTRQKGTMDVTAWLAWFLDTLRRAIGQSHHTLQAVLAKARFWQRWGGTALNERQLKLLNRLLDGFDGKLTSRKWAAIAKCSPDTALRDITDLLAKGVLHKADAGGRSTRYELAPT